MAPGVYFQNACTLKQYPVVDLIFVDSADSINIKLVFFSGANLKSREMKLGVIFLLEKSQKYKAVRQVFDLNWINTKVY